MLQMEKGGTERRQRGIESASSQMAESRVQPAVCNHARQFCKGHVGLKGYGVWRELVEEGFEGEQGGDCYLKTAVTTRHAERQGLAGSVIMYDIQERSDLLVPMIRETEQFPLTEQWVSCN